MKNIVALIDPEDGVSQNKVLPADNAAYQYYLAGALELSGQTDAALAAADAAGKIDSESAQFAGRRAWILYHAKRYDDALAAFMTALGHETWFRLGDRDLATHVQRTRRLAAGATLSEVTAELCARFRIGSRIVPMSDQPVPTEVITGDGVLAFQDYFVRRRAEPAVSGVRYRGAESATAAPQALAALADPHLQAIVIAPSNPWLSIGPLLAVPGLATALRAARVPVVAVSPIVGGAAIKGPTARIMANLGLAPDNQSIARHYRGLIHGLILDRADAAEAAAVEALGVRTAVTGTVMRSLDDKRSLAQFTLRFAASLRNR